MKYFSYISISHALSKSLEATPADASYPDEQRLDAFAAVRNLPYYPVLRLTRFPHACSSPENLKSGRCFCKITFSFLHLFRHQCLFPVLCIVVYCCVLLCIVVYCCVLLCIVVYCCVLLCTVVYCCVLLCMYCRVLSCIVVYRNVAQGTAMLCSLSSSVFCLAPCPKVCRPVLHPLGGRSRHLRLVRLACFAASSVAAAVLRPSLWVGNQKSFASEAASRCFKHGC